MRGLSVFSEDRFQGAFQRPGQGVTKESEMSKKPFIYVASPYTKGDPCVNANFQCRVFDQMLDDGVVIPYIPLWSHFQHSVHPRPYKDWIEYDLVIMPRMDALVRLDAEFKSRDWDYKVSESSGADGEVKLAQSLGIPTFTSIDDLYDWARTVYGPAHDVRHEVRVGGPAH